MTLQSELLGKLHKLSSSDRAWIVEHLSESERSQLFSTLSDSAPTAEVVATRLTAVEPPAAPDAVKALGRVEPRHMAALAKSESAWLVAVLVSAQSEDWRAAFLEASPAVLRAEVERIQARTYGAALTESVARLMLARSPMEVPRESVFERLVERLGSSRSKRRMTLHL